MIEQRRGRFPEDFEVGAGIRTRGANQRALVAIEFTRSFTVFKRAAAEVADDFPATEAPWTVGGATA